MVCDGKEEMLFEEVSRLNARRTMSKLGRSLQPLCYIDHTQQLWKILGVLIYQIFYDKDTNCDMDRLLSWIVR